MKIGFFPKLAAENIRKNSKIYLPYILTCILTTAMYYIMKSLSLNPGMEGVYGGGYLTYIMGMGSYIIAIFSVIFLFYTYSFLNKRRKKEFGLFNILGMEKRHIAVMMGWETLYVALLSLSLGTGLGIALDKVMFLLIVKLIGAEITLGFFIAPAAVGSTATLFGVIFLLTLCSAVLQLHRSNPVELLRGAKAGEKEPKAKWFFALLGLAAVGIGYYIAIVTENPTAAILLFFVAVLLVVVGTYLLFTAGSIALLKMLRANKRFYYRTNHFVSVSGMIYRMKQNAVGLANICILSTMVLVMVSGTVSLEVGMEDVLRVRYPADFTIYSYSADPEMAAPVKELQKDWEIDVTKELEYTYLYESVVRKGNEFIGQDLDAAIMKSIVNLIFLSLDDYNAVTGENRILQGNEILVHSDRGRISSDSIRILDKEYRIAGKADKSIALNGVMASQVFSTYFIVVPDMEALYRICDDFDEPYESIWRYYGFDVTAKEEEKLAIYSEIQNRMSYGFKGRVETRAGQKEVFMQLYGGLFFLGIFLAVLFIMTAVLIIYYKQISEGYDDRERFEIMQKVGMGTDEVKKAIHSQVLTVFFLPLIMAGIHITAAFPMIARLLAMLNMLNTKLYALCVAGVFLAFAFMYALIYSLTAKTYYRIVSGGRN